MRLDLTPIPYTEREQLAKLPQNQRELDEINALATRHNIRPLISSNKLPEGWECSDFMLYSLGIKSLKDPPSTEEERGIWGTKIVFGLDPRFVRKMPHEELRNTLHILAYTWQDRERGIVPTHYAIAIPNKIRNQPPTIISKYGGRDVYSQTKVFALPTYYGNAVTVVEFKKDP
jgi:hypothetical protein